MTKLILVRHAEAEGNILRRFHGHTNSNVTENGYLQLEKLRERIKREEIDVLYSSDLIRTCETAKVISEVKKLEIIIEKDLREIYGGDWEDKSWQELEQNCYESFENWTKSPHKLEIPGGESMVGFYNRVLSIVKKIISINLGKNICVVTHGTVIKALLTHFYGINLCDMESIKWHDNASISIIEINGNNYKVLLDGDNSHLGECSTLGKQSWWKNEKITEDN